ncbi:molybdenum cofactor guanylyltransferase [Fredinandcohnia humi]
MNHTKITGVILAGGESRRFGSHKAFATFEGHYFYEYSYKALQHNVDELFVVSHPSIRKRFEQESSLQIIEDLPQYQGNGPLAGILSAMKKSSSDWFVVLPCDTPRVSDFFVNQLLAFTNKEEVDAIVPVIDGRKQPLLAAYHSRLSEKIEELLRSKKFKMGFLLESCHSHYVTNEELKLDGIEFDNINSLSEYEKLTDNQK